MFYLLATYEICRGAFLLYVFNSPNLNNIVCVDASDMDNDGDLDIISTSWYDSTITWYENDGSKNFEAHIITSKACKPRILHIADIDSDGDMDVLSFTGYLEIAWHENNGSGLFTSHAIDASVLDVSGFSSGDFDNDGDIDLLTSSMDSYRTEWYENDGYQNFTIHTIANDTRGTLDVHTSDVDGDGDLDVLSAITYSDKIVWYKNSSSIINVTAPDRNDSWPSGSRQNIRWSSDGQITYVDLFYSDDGGSNWIPIANSISNSTKAYEWTVANTVSDSVRVKVQVSGTGRAISISDMFSITAVVTTSDRDSTFSDTTRHSLVTDNNPTVIMDTVITTTVVDSIVDSTFHITDTLLNNMVTRSIIDSITVAKRAIQISQNSVTKENAVEITTTVRDSIKSDTTLQTVVTDNSPTGTMDTIVTTKLIKTILDSTWEITDTLADGVYLKRATPLFKLVLESSETETKSIVTKAYQPKITTTVRDSIKSDTTEYSFETDNTPSGTMDTVVTTTIVDTIVDSIWNITDSYLDDVYQSSSTPLFKAVIKGEEQVSQSSVTKAYVAPPEKTESVRTSVTETRTGESTITVNNDPSGTMDTVVTTTIVDTVTVSTWETTEIYQGETLLSSSAPIFAGDSIWVDTLSNSIDTLRYVEDKVAIESLPSSLNGTVEDLQFAPNPVSVNSDGVLFVTPSSLKGKWTVAIFDALGNELDSQEFDSDGGYTYRWDLRNSSGVKVGSGTYVAVISVESEEGHQKLFKRMIGVRK